MKQFEAPRWWDKFAPSKPAKEYEWLVREAKEKTALLVANADVLDQKADNVLRYIGLVTAAFAGAAPFLSREVPYYWWVQPPAILFLLVAGFFAVWAAMPQQMEALPDLTSAFKAAEAFKENAEIRYMAFTVEVEASLRKLIIAKGKKITAAIVLLLFALIWLAAATPIALLAAPTPPPCPRPSISRCFE